MCVNYTTHDNMIECFMGKRVLYVNRQAYEKFYYGTISETCWIMKWKKEELEQKSKFLVKYPEDVDGKI